MVHGAAPRRFRQQWWSPLPLLLVVLMAVGSVAMWIGLPLGLVWIASAISDSPQPSMGPYLLVLIGLPVGMVAIGKLLGMLDRWHGRITGTLDEAPIRAAWLQSMRGDRKPQRRRRSVLDVVMVLSVGAALLALAIWFLLLAGSPLPQ